MKSEFVTAALEKRIVISYHILGLFDELDAELKTMKIEQSNTRFGENTLKVVYTMRAKKKFRNQLWTVCVIGANGSTIFKTSTGGSRTIGYVCALLAKVAGIPVKQQKIFVLGADSDQPAEGTMTIAAAAAAASAPHGSELQLYMEVTDSAGQHHHRLVLSPLPWLSLLPSILLLII